MDVRELIDLLQQFPAGLRVVVNGYEEGYDDLSLEQISVAKIRLNTGKHRWEGRHGELRDLTKGSPEPPDVVEALVLRRSSH